MPPGSPFSSFAASSNVKRPEIENARASSVIALSIALLSPVIDFTPVLAVEPELTSCSPLRMSKVPNRHDR